MFQLFRYLVKENMDLKLRWSRWWSFIYPYNLGVNRNPRNCIIYRYNTSFIWYGC